VRSRLRGEDGVAMVLVMLLLAFTTLVSVTLIDLVRGEANRSAHSVWSQASYQAAEAGLDDYISKLVDDHAYYLHYVHAAESTRRPPSGDDVGAGTAWPYSRIWTYSNGKDTWKPLPNGYEYNLQIAAPSPGAQDVHIIATGRRTGSTTDMRAVETLVRPSSIADYQMLANADISYGLAASTYGKIYAGIDLNGVKHNVDHRGTAYVDVYAEGSVTGPPTLMNGAQKYSSGTIRTVIKKPISFQNFLASLVDIQRAATVANRYFDDPSTAAWLLTFVNDGTVMIQKCAQVGINSVAAVQPICGAATSYGVPSNGAMYFTQTAIVQGAVRGRVTVASNDKVVIANDIAPVTPGTDVIGLISSNDMIVAEWCPANLTWRAGTLAQNGRWRSWSGGGSHNGTMTFTGSTATNGGGYMSMFTTRVYNYDDTLLYLPPPWFPAVEDAYTVSLFREVKP